MSNRSSIYILVEDKRHQSFIRGFLTRVGIGRREMIFAPISQGRGSGKQSVLSQFPDQVRVCRRRNRYASTSMFVMLDADDLTVARCLRALDDQLVNEGLEPVDRARDRITRLVPRWSIETWLLYLSSSGNTESPLSEEKSCKNTKKPEQWDQMVPSALQTLYAWTRPAAKLPDNLLDSLRLGLQEIPRALPERR